MNYKEALLQLAKNCAHACPRSYKPEDPRWGTEDGCKNCPLRVNNPDFLNCSLIVAQMGEHTVEEISEMMNMPTYKVDEILFNAQKNFKKKLMKIKDKDNELKRVGEQSVKKLILPKGR